MMLTIEQSQELLERFGCYVTEACDKCGAVLGAVRFTRKDEAGVWCSRECRGDGERQKTRKGGRPRKYKDERTRKHVHAQQQSFRMRSSVTKTWQQPLVSMELTGAKSAFSHYHLSRSHLARKTAPNEFGGESV